jgi:hypothetical protein
LLEHPNIVGVRTPHADLSEVTGMVWSMLLASVIECKHGRLEACRGSLRFLAGTLPHVQTAIGRWLRTLIEVGAVVVLFVELARVPLNPKSPSPYLTTGHTTTTRMLSVLADTTGEIFRQYGFDVIGRFVATYPLPADTWGKQSQHFGRERNGIGRSVHGRGAFLSWKTG